MLTLDKVMTKSKVSSLSKRRLNQLVDERLEKMENGSASPEDIELWKEEATMIAQILLRRSN